jgi:CHAD domain-containing protein
MIFDRTVHEAFLKAFPQKVGTMLDTLKGHIDKGRDSLEEDTVHDTRVWSRRLSEALSIGAILIDRKPSRSLKMLSALRTSLGRLRDNHVQRSLAIEYGIEGLPEHLEARGERLAAQASRSLVEFDMERLERDFLHFHRELIVVCDDGNLLERNTERISGRIEKRYSSVGKSFAGSDPADFATLHNSRISIKKLRYTLETLDGYTGLDGDTLALLKKIQDRLGKVQDLTVLLKTIGKLVTKRRLSVPGEIVQRISIDRHMLVSEFLDGWRDELAAIRRFIEEPSLNQCEREDIDRINPRSGAAEKFSDGTIEKILSLAGEMGLSYRGVVAYLKENPAICDRLGIEGLPSYQTLARRAGRLGKRKKPGGRS